MVRFYPTPSKNRTARSEGRWELEALERIYSSDGKLLRAALDALRPELAIVHEWPNKRPSDVDRDTHR